MPSAQTPLHLRHLYHQIVEFSHAALPLGWTSAIAQDLDERHVRSSSSSPPRNAHAVVRRRLVDRLLLLRGSFKGATNNRGHAPRRGYSPRATQGLLRHSDPDPVRPFGFHHLLHWQRSPTGFREEVLCATSSNARAAVRGRQESSARSFRPPSAFLRDSHLLLARSSSDSLSSPRSLQRERAVQAKVFPLSSSCRQPALLEQLLRQEPREPARTLARSTIYCPLHRRIGHHRLGFLDHGFKKCGGFQPSTSACRLRIFVSDRTTPTSSNLSSTEEYNFGQWSSTVCETWSSAKLCVARHSRRQLAHSLVSLARMRARSLVRHQALQQEASRHLARAYSNGGFVGQLHTPQCVIVYLLQALKEVSGCYKEDVEILLLNRTTRNGSSSKTSSRKYRMMQGRHT
jgi:hypothetical protein